MTVTVLTDRSSYRPPFLVVVRCAGTRGRGKEGQGKTRVNPIAKFDRAEFPAPNIYSQS